VKQNKSPSSLQLVALPEPNILMPCSTADKEHLLQLSRIPLVWHKWDLTGTKFSYIPDYQTLLLNLKNCLIYVHINTVVL
jgi:hypothetical protein